jgi:hypothetical protein
MDQNQLQDAGAEALAAMLDADRKLIADGVKRSRVLSQQASDFARSPGVLLPLTGPGVPAAVSDSAG